MAASAPPSTAALPPTIPSAGVPPVGVPLPPHMGEPGVTRAWADHVTAGRIGAAPAATPRGADFRLAGLAAILGHAAPRTRP